MPLINTIFQHLRTQHLVEVKGMQGNDYNFTLSTAGKNLAAERFQLSQYAGAAPVPWSKAAWAAFSSREGATSCA